jgi:hemolysin activation/secretion protein
MTPVKYKLIQISVAAYVGLFAASAARAASPPPDAGTLLNTVKPLPQQPEKPPENLITAPDQPRPAMQNKVHLKVVVNRVVFSGVHAFPESVLQTLIADKIGKELNFDDLTHLTGMITKYYRDHGYIVARAYLPEQPITDNTIEIVVLEGKLGKVIPHYKTPGPKISDEQLQSLVTHQIPEGASLTLSKLERALLLENELPNVKATATLVPGASVGTSDLVLEATQQGWLTNNTIDADNFGSRYSGVGRYGGSVNIASPAGLGDVLSVRGLTSFKGFDYARLSWTAPVGGSGLKIGIADSYSDYALGGPFESAGLKGNSNVASLFSVYPYLRSRFFNLYQTASIENKRLFNNSNAGEISDQYINAISLGIHGDDYDSWMGGGLSTFSITYTGGKLDLASNAADAANDAATAQTAGAYSKVLVQAVRQQFLANNLILYGSITNQWASKNLSSSESLAMGGPTAVRAYPVGEAPADEGLLATAELRYNTLAPHNLGSLQYQLFYDYGRVRLHKNTWESLDAAGTPNAYTLAGFGVGTNLYKENAYLISATLATKVGSNPNPGDNGTDADGLTSTTRFWLQATVYW